MSIIQCPLYARLLIYEWRETCGGEEKREEISREKKKRGGLCSSRSERMDRMDLERRLRVMVLFYTGRGIVRGLLLFGMGDERKWSIQKHIRMGLRVGTTFLLGLKGRVRAGWRKVWDGQVISVYKDL